jgi:hypothetical protein
MKKIILVLVSLLPVVATSPLVAQETLTIPAGTAIRIRTTQVVSSETARVGDDVAMEVLADVSVNGYVVIRQGAPVIALVSIAKEAKTMGRRGHVGISLKYVESITGDHVFVSGERLEKGDGKKAKMAAEVGATALISPVGSLLWLFETGNDSVIPPGTAFTVYTAADAVVDLERLPPGVVLQRTRPTGPENLKILGIVIDSDAKSFFAKVSDVVRDGPADRAGIRVGYLITSVNGVQTRNVREVSDAIAMVPQSATAMKLGYSFPSNIGWMPKEVSVPLKQ